MPVGQRPQLRLRRGPNHLPGRGEPGPHGRDVLRCRREPRPRRRDVLRCRRQPGQSGFAKHRGHDLKLLPGPDISGPESGCGRKCLEKLQPLPSQPFQTATNGRPILVILTFLRFLGRSIGVSPTIRSRSPIKSEPAGPVPVVAAALVPKTPPADRTSRVRAVPSRWSRTSTPMRPPPNDGCPQLHGSSRTGRFSWLRRRPPSAGRPNRLAPG